MLRVDVVMMPFFSSYRRLRMILLSLHTIASATPLGASLDTNEGKTD